MVNVVLPPVGTVAAGPDVTVKLAAFVPSLVIASPDQVSSAGILDRENRVCRRAAGDHRTNVLASAVGDDCPRRLLHHDIREGHNDRGARDPVYKHGHHRAAQERRDWRGQ